VLLVIRAKYVLERAWEKRLTNTISYGFDIKIKTYVVPFSVLHSISPFGGAFNSEIENLLIAILKRFHIC